MKSVVICGLKQFEEKMEEFATPLRKAGVEPSFLYSPSESEDRIFRETWLMWGHSIFIRKADVLFVYNEADEMDSYIVSMIDCAIDQKIPIYVLEDMGKLKGKHSCLKLASTPQELLEKLQD